MDGDRQSKSNGESAVAATHRGADQKTSGISTLAVHAGEPRPKFGNALATPIIQTATYTFLDTQELRDHFERRIEREEYGRYGNPTQHIAEQSSPPLKAPGIACSSPAAWPPSRRPCTPCFRTILMSS